ncbi:MAG: HEAT repeat domain-containing protein [Spirochaetales bacterium]|nr:HEAT repeat domain-containing protein [Spirochaetales bacterium]
MGSSAAPNLSVALLALLFAFAGPASADDAESLDASRRAVLAYGIESEVLALLDELEAAKDYRYDRTVSELLASSRSVKLKSGILAWFAKTKGKAAESFAVGILETRDEGERELVAAAFAYLAAIESEAALPEARKAVGDREKDWIESAVTLLGAAGGSAEAELLGELIDDDESGDDLKQRATRALGALGDTAALERLEALLADGEERSATRIYAAQSLGKIASPRSAAVLSDTVASEDPNLRAAVYEALGLVGAAAGADPVEAALMEGLRDPNAKARIAAVEAVAVAGVSAAIDALEYKASRDPERAVKTAAIKSLGKLGGAKASRWLSDLFVDPKADAGLRALAFGALAANDRSEVLDKAPAVFASTATPREKTFRAALVRELLAVDDPLLAPLVEPLLSDPDIGNRSAALEWARRNGAASLRAAIAAVAESDASEAVRRRAADVLGDL